MAFILLLSLASLLTAACQRAAAEGEIAQDAAIAELRYEQLGDDLEGVVYRRVENLERLLARSDQPVLLAIWRADDPQLAYLIPFLEELADRQRTRLRIIHVDPDLFPEIAARIDFGATPAFALIRDSVILRVREGFGQDGARQLTQFLAPDVMP